MNGSFFSTVRRMLVAVIFVAGLTAFVGGCAENKCCMGDKQCASCCGKCPKDCCKGTAKNCPADCQKACCKQAKNCPPDCQKPCCKKA